MPPTFGVYESISTFDASLRCQMELAGARVLITGGGGFVGLPTVRALLAEGAHIRVLDSSPSSQLQELGCEVILADIADESAVDNACENIDAIIHLAVLPLIFANSDHKVAFETNVRGSFNVFTAAGRQGVKRVVYSSASSAYGPIATTPISESHPLRPAAFYPATKAAAEMILRGLAASYGYSFVILRYMNVYGPGQRIGVVSAVARRLREGERPQLSGDGTQAFDFIHINDCARANTLALRAEVDGEDFNVGHGSSTSLNEIVGIMGELLGRRVEPTYEGTAAPSTPRVGSITKAREMLGFTAGVSLRDGLSGVLDETDALDRTERR